MISTCFGAGVTSSESTNTKDNKFSIPLQVKIALTAVFKLLKR
jgi:hypothetical protein